MERACRNTTAGSSSHGCRPAWRLPERLRTYPERAPAQAGPGEASGSKGYDGHGDNIVPQPRDVAEGPVVAYVRDAPSGEISIFVGSREITVHDPSIAATLAHAASKGV